MKEVLRSKENVPFTQIANAVLEDKDISWKAKGIFSYLYSRPQDWDFSGHRIKNNAKDGRDSTYEGLKELEEAGYLIRTRNQDGSVDYDISWRKPDTENPDKPNPENPQYGKPVIRKTRTVSNKDLNTNKDKETNKETATNVAPKPDSFFDRLKRKERMDDGVPMNLQEFVLMCRGSAYRHIKVIAEYADEKKTSFETRGQWREFGRRNLAVARRLAPYNDRQMSKAMERMEKDFKDKGGFLSKWTLETLEKYLDDN